MLTSQQQQRLLSWYDVNKRDLPWRQTNDPWAILVSEILLQQTQVSRGRVYWHRMMERFPTVASMAIAPVDDVLKAWEGAGYYSRARRLHALSQTVVASVAEGGFGGALPRTFDALLTLPGVGPYTAAAVASIAFEQAVACVDGNIRRVMARITAQEDPAPGAVQAWADASIVGARPGDWNQALMELGATVCTPKRVGCHQCPLYDGCEGSSSPESYPRPKPKRVKKTVLTAYVEWAQDGHLVLHQRPSTGLFSGLWGPIYREGTFPVEDGSVACGAVSHKLSHRDMTVHVVAITTSKQLHGTRREDVALSSLDEKVLKAARKGTMADH